MEPGRPASESLILPFPVTSSFHDGGDDDRSIYIVTHAIVLLLRGFSDMVCINKGDSVPSLTLVKTLRSICFYVFFFVSVFVSVCVSVFVSLFISW